MAGSPPYEPGGQEVPEPWEEAEDRGPEKPLVTGETIRKGLLALLAALGVALVVVVTVAFLRVAKFPWLA